MKKKQYLVIGIILLVTHFLVYSYSFLWAVNSTTKFERERNRYATVYGRVTDWFLKEPISNVTILFFVGEQNEIPYVEAVYSIHTDENGYYVMMMPIRNNAPEVIAVKKGYQAIDVYIGSQKPSLEMWYGFSNTPEQPEFRSAIYCANFRMFQFAQINMTESGG